MPGLIALIDNRESHFERNRHLVRDMAGLISHESFYKSLFVDHDRPRLCADKVYLDHEPFGDSIGSSHDGHIQCLFSGELFGLKDLFNRLGDGRQINHRNSDPGSIVARLYEKHGEAMLSFLNGYFHLLLIDKRENTLIVANDRFGMHRLYFCRLPDGGMMFAPEVKCFRMVPELKLTLDDEAVVHSFRHDCILNNGSFYREVKRLPIATCFRYRDSEWRSHEYWTPETKCTRTRISPETFMAEATVAFEAAVGDYYTPDRTALSFTGGLDTRAVLAVLNERGIKPPLFTFGGSLRDSHDVTIARRIAKRNGNFWQVIRLSDEFLDNYEHWANRAVWISDGIARLNTCHEYYLNLAVREIGKVRLTGKYGSQIVRGVTMLKDRSPDLRIFSADFRQIYQETPSRIVGSGRSALLREELPQLEGARHTLEAAALTVRTPYMDNRMVDVMLHAPEITNTSLLQRKIIAKHAPHLSDIPTNRGELATGDRRFSPTKIYYKSLNFVDSVYNWEKLPRLALPVCRLGDITGISRLFVGRNEWIHHRVWFKGRLKGFVGDLILDAQTRNRPFYDGEALQRMMKAHFCGRGNYTPEIIKIGSFELWCRQNRI